MEVLTSFRSFKLAPVPAFVAYGIYAVLAIVILLILRDSFKQNEAEGRVLSFYKVVVVALFGNFLMNIIFSCAFALYFMVFNPKYEAEVVDSITHIERGAQRSIKKQLYNILFLS